MTNSKLIQAWARANRLTYNTTLIDSDTGDVVNDVVTNDDDTWAMWSENGEIYASFTDPHGESFTSPIAPEHISFVLKTMNDPDAFVTVKVDTELK